jgi:hypothetical protein
VLPRVAILVLALFLLFAPTLDAATDDLDASKCLSSGAPDVSLDDVPALVDHDDALGPVLSRLGWVSESPVTTDSRGVPALASRAPPRG